MRNSTLRWAIALMAIGLIQVQSSLAQRAWESIPAYDGLQVRNEMLVFSNKTVFDQVYQDLEQRIALWNDDPDVTTPEPKTEQDCPDDNTVLALFAQRYPITSIREVSLQRECEWLNTGGNPMEFEGHHLVDEILAALFNERYQVQVGTDIYYIPEPGVTYTVANADLSALAALEQGESPYGLRNVTVHGPEGGCEANFSVNTDYSTTNVGFAFTGEPQGGDLSYFWEFGDGTTSAASNPIHNYSSAGTYTVCLTIKASKPESCIDRVCKTIQVGSDGCQPYFIYNETGQPGGVCFIDNSQFLQNVVSWNWQFGDGSPLGNQPNPCHTFPCDKTYFVTLTIETSGGCTGYFSLPVTVNSYGCCASSASKVGSHYYAGNSKMIKYNQRHVQIPILYHRVVSNLKNYKRKSNGKWKKEAANLQINLQGNVFLPSQTGCKCNLPFNIVNTALAFNKKNLTITKAVGKAFKSKIENEWSAGYTVNNALLTQETTPVICE
ncbi:MAG: PKD domain-containing protein [Lewinellaceae bacterium]|nr:PKD domain-containing protein [Lewinellaceae bacterium]